MAIVKVKLRLSSVESKKGTIFYQVTHTRKTQQITTNLHIYPHEWDPDNECLIESAHNHTMLQNRIDSDVALLHCIIKKLDKTGIDYAVTDIVKRFRQTNRQPTFFAFMRQQIESLYNVNRLGTARNYEKALCSFSAFLQGEDIHFSMITEKLIESYNAWLIRRGIVRNSISFYMRILRAVFNKAVRQHLTESAHPFQDVYTGIDRTRKRAISESTITQLYRLDLQSNPTLALARDIFIFSYCTRGMAFVDIAYLKKSNIQDGTICYSRRKTGQPLCIKIEENIREIIEKYSSEKREHIFPIIFSDDTQKAYKQYRHELNNHNRRLKELSTMLPTDCRLTSYTSRHSWATVARNHNVPISVISAGLGHTSEQTTQIYLTMLENSVIDEANKGIIRGLTK